MKHEVLITEWNGHFYGIKNKNTTKNNTEGDKHSYRVGHDRNWQDMGIFNINLAQDKVENKQESKREDNKGE